MALDPTIASAARLASTIPMLVGAGRLDAHISLSSHTLLHAGPPYRPGEDVPQVVRNAAAAAAVAEGWARNLEDGHAALAAGDIVLAPAQDHGLVVPLAFVAGPSTGILIIECPNTGAIGRAPINDGPPAGAARFGAPDADAADRLKWLGDVMAPALDLALKAAPIAMTPIAARALKAGDDLHAGVSNGNAALQAALAPALAGANTDVAEYLKSAQQFFLNTWMASAACMLSAATRLRGSRLLVRAGANGLRAGFSIASEPDRWIERPAQAPVGPSISPDVATSPAARAVGDSAVIEAAGFGALASHCAPDIVQAFRPFLPKIYERRSSLTVAEAPNLGELKLKVGVDAGRVTPESPLPGHFAILDAAGVQGLIGRGAVILADRII